MMEAVEDGLSKDLFAGFSACDAFLEKAANYAKTGYVSKALLVLSAISPMLIEATVENSKSEGFEEEDKTHCEEFFSKLENSWADVFEAYGTPPPSGSQSDDDKAPNDVATLEEYFKELATWRTQLTPSFGPLFSQPLRTLKKKILKIRGKASTSSSSSSATGPASKKAKH
mmetsp:Transcript_37679/g.74148  ORF Transcript_37679/g.74148 Transcript_37679/m.74148 type:complete len:171 (+) Transcript_37679:215-727(+)